MADTVNRVWVSVERGSYGANKLVKFFAGGDTVEDVLGQLSKAFGVVHADNIIGHVAELGTEEAFDNLKSGGLAGGDSSPASGGGAASGNPDGPICKHGPKQFKTGMGKNGKQWSAWMCPAQKGDPSQCPPEWLK